MTLRNRFLVVLGLLLANFNLSAQTGSGTICDARKKPEASIVWALDLSASLDAKEYQTQIQGYISALENKAVRSNFLYCQCSEVSVVAWADSSAIIEDFKTLKSENDIDELIQSLVKMRDSYSYEPAVGQQTDVLQALKFSADLVLSRKESEKGQRLMVTLSGDGAHGRIYPEILEEFQLQKKTSEQSGITVNGVPIVVYPEIDFLPISTNALISPLASGGIDPYSKYRDTSEFYKDQVVTKDGYVEKAEDFSQFADTIKNSILRDSCQLMM